jgi:hypothetical protein
LSRGRLEQAAREWLYRAYVEIPRPRTITVLVRGVVQSVALQDHRNLRGYMTDYTVQGFIKELVSPRPLVSLPHLGRGPRPALLREQGFDRRVGQCTNWQYTYSRFQFICLRPGI